MSLHHSSVNAGERLKILDVLRGFALMGIFAANVYIFDLESLSEVEDSFEALAVGLADIPFLVFTSVFILNKMMALFSMLFGAGILLLAERLEARKEASLNIHYTRNGILAVVGLIHGLLWFGDVLLIYALCAFVLFPLRRWSSRSFVLLGSMLWVAVLTTSYWPGSSGLIADYALRAIAMMLLGMALYRSGILTAARDLEWYRKKCVRLLGVGLPVCLVAWGFYDANQSLSKLVHNIGVPCVALGYLCLVIHCYQRGVFPKLTARLAAAGQMALTNYLLQTGLGTALVAICNEVRGERVSVFWMMLITFAVWALQLGWSEPWMRRFEYGPVEWLWRSATYRRIQPFKSVG